MSFTNDPPAPYTTPHHTAGASVTSLGTSIPKPSFLFFLPRICLFNKWTGLNLFNFFLEVKLLWRT
jgi:hypothetical protein